VTKAVSRIDPDWLKAPHIRKIFDALGTDGVRVVGGAVRDTLIGRSVKDIDMATVWHPEDTQIRLEQAGIRVIPTGLQHGTVTAVMDGASVEITTLRRDVTTDGRHAEVAFTRDWTVGASRRDFTMNALYAAADGMVHDPFGGEADLHAGIVRFIGSAGDRIREDALRILRFFRFHAGYGRGEPEPEALEAAATLAPMLERLSVERIRDELLKLLSYDDPVPCLRAMISGGVWRHLPVGPADTAALAGYIRAERAAGFNADVIMRLAVLTGPDRPELGRDLKLSGREQRALASAAQGLRHGLPLSVQDLRVLLYHHGLPAGKAAVLGSLAESPAAFLQLLHGWQCPEFPLLGRDLMAAGVPAGPQMGALLKELEASWIASGFTLDRLALLAMLPPRQR
jgi:poly(A) polymerase